jgi:hypothetical protein
MIRHPKNAPKLQETWLLLTIIKPIKPIPDNTQKHIIWQSAITDNPKEPRLVKTQINYPASLEKSSNWCIGM